MINLPSLLPPCYGSLDKHHRVTRNLRGSFNGRISAFQADSASSILAPRSIYYIMNKEEDLRKVAKMQNYFLEKELAATNDGVRRYYSGVAAGLSVAYKLLEDELSFSFIRDNL